MADAGMNVLVVTDGVWIENDVRAALTDPGTTVTRITDPMLTVEAALQYSPDVVVIDLQVGSAGGMAVVRALRSAVDAGVLEPVRTVLLLDRNADHFIARRADADAAVVKPFTAQELRAAVALLTPA